jgi:8-oxo-dGTP pyrophosphatase MutT (NUDIX family)
MSKRLLRTLIREVIAGNMRGSRRFEVPSNVRYGEPTTGQAGGNVLTDEENERSQAEQRTMKAATVLCISDDGKVLAVSRRDDPTAFGLPGGKVDPGETPEQAAARELQEETGLTATDLKPVFVREEDDGFTTTTFVGKVSGQIRTDEEGVVRWVDREVLFNGPFGTYNRALFKRLGL